LGIGADPTRVYVFSSTARRRTESAMKFTSEPPQAVVFIVDDDASLRDALGALFRIVGLDVKDFASAQEFLNSKLPDAPSCLVLDIRLPGQSGLDIQAELAKAGVRIPIIFMTAHGDIPMSVRAMKAGAVEFLPKPFRDQDMLDAVQLALARDRSRREQEDALATVRAKFETLSPREREVMELVVSGLMNKQIAARMGIAEVTVKIHRGNASHKMGARSISELVKMAQALGLGGEKA
jgi:FixJ family two-component response regulator